MLTVETELLLLSIRVTDDIPPFSGIAELTGGGRVDWNRVYRLASLHAIRPQVARLITGAAGESGVPGDFIEKITEAYRENLITQLKFAAEFLEIEKILAGEGIEIVPFKGFWLGYDAYGNMADREGNDVDVFVSARHLDRIRAIMEANGYLVEPAFRGLTIGQVERVSQEYVFEKYSNGVSNFRIEYHWGISPPAYGMGVRIESLKQQITRGRFQDQEITLFTPEAQMLLLLLHHGGDDRFILLKQVYDIALMLKRYPDLDWQWIIRTAEMYGAGRLPALAALIASELTGVAVPQPLLRAVEARNIRRLAGERVRLLTGPEENYFTTSFHFMNWLFRMRSRRGAALKMRMTLEAVRVKAGRITCPDRPGRRQGDYSGSAGGEQPSDKMPDAK